MFTCKVALLPTLRHSCSENRRPSREVHEYQPLCTCITMQYLNRRAGWFASAGPAPRIVLPLHHAASSTCRAATASATAAPTSKVASAPSTGVHAPAYKAAIDMKAIKENLPAVVQNCKNRNSSANPERAVQLYDEFVHLKGQVDALRAERNTNASQMKGKMDADKRAELIAKGQQLKEQLAELEVKLTQVEGEMQLEAQRIPNMTHPDVPIGGEDVAAAISIVGSQRQFNFEPKDHVTVGEALDLLDFDAAAEVSGQKFYYLRNAGALLELALVNWAMTKVTARGFTPIMTPDLVKETVLEKCGFQPRGTNTQVYSVEGSPLCLTGTAEVPLGGIYMDKVLSAADLPIKMAAFGHCFRTEAGAAGAAGKGLYRVHQFSKVEMFVLCTPEQSNQLHEELRQIETELYTELGLHFKVLDMPSGDLGAPAYRKYDIEAWMPGLKRYGEISSASNCTDYQSRRLNIRYRPEADAAAHSTASGKDGKGKKGQQGGRTEFVHTLNATACAVPRMIVAILENFQQEDGSVLVPEVLQPFLGGMKVITPPPHKKQH